MVREHHTFECEICGEEYQSAEDAAGCEQSLDGVPKPEHLIGKRIRATYYRREATVTGIDIRRYLPTRPGHTWILLTDDIMKDGDHYPHDDSEAPNYIEWQPGCDSVEVLE